MTISTLVFHRAKTYSSWTPKRTCELKTGSAWQTDEIRQHRPTPVDNGALQPLSKRFGMPYLNSIKWISSRQLPTKLTTQYLRFASWMGGDRDGNPNVTLPKKCCGYHAGKLLTFTSWKLALGTFNPDVFRRNDFGSQHAEPYREYLRATREKQLATG